MRRRTLLKRVSGGASDTQDPAKTGYADAVLVNKSTNDIVIVKASGTTLDLSGYPASDYTPIGVVVVPGSHNVYGDGTCGVMSFAAMHCDTPETGSSTEQTMCWGSNSTDISTLPNLSNVPSLGSPVSTADPNNTSLSSSSYGYLPSTNSGFTVPSADISSCKYYNSTSTTYGMIPSPYNADGTRNPLYYSSSISNNALADFDGVGNTDKIIAQRGSKDSSWKPTYNTAEDYPAASCCRLFHTDGTNAGDWYLGACGEIGYIIARFKEINASLAALKAAYPSAVGVQLNSGSNYWSSSEYSGYGARYVNTDFGCVYSYYKSNGYRVRAFLRVGSAA